MNSDWAYAYCQEITRHEAANFYYGIRLLPPERAARCARSTRWRGASTTSATARRRARRRSRRLDERAAQAGVDRHGLRRPGAGRARATPSGRFPIPVDAFGELIDGVEMDVAGTRLRDLRRAASPYCRCVAGSVGRLCLGVFGPARRRRRRPSTPTTLGVALQLTNILRDIREDLGNGRVYLPRGGPGAVRLRRCRRAGRIADGRRRWSGSRPTRARAGTTRGLRLLPLLDRRSAACVARDGRHLPAAARPDRRRPELVLARPAVSLPGLGEGAGSPSGASPRSAP